MVYLIKLLKNKYTQIALLLVLAVSAYFYWKDKIITEDRVKEEIKVIKEIHHDKEEINEIFNSPSTAIDTSVSELLKQLKEKSRLQCIGKDTVYTDRAGSRRNPYLGTQSRVRSGEGSSFEDYPELLPVGEESPPCYDCTYEQIKE